MPHPRPVTAAAGRAPCVGPRGVRGAAVAAVLLAAAAGCDHEPPAAWRECAAEAGLAIPLCGGGDAAVKQTILEVNGTGAALADLDADGDLDVVLVDGSTRARLVSGDTVEHVVLLNDGVRDGIPRFTRQAGSGLLMAGWPSGIAVGDVDRDGRPDLVIGGIGEDALFLNRTAPGGPCRFEKRALPGRSSPRDWTSSLALADADGDGLLDIYLARYLDIDPADPPMGRIGDVACTFHGLPVMCGPHGMPPQPDVLLLGTGDGGFRDASESSGIRAAGTAYGLGVLFADLDADGRPDLYVANDSVDNFVLRNRGDGSFEDRSALSGAATDLAGRAQAGMGVDLGDLDRDGDFDLVVTNFSDESNALYRNDGRLLFRELSAVTGLAEVSRPMLGWGVHLADFDADGWLDLYVSNGHVYPEADDPASGSRYAQPQHLLPGGPGLRFGSNVFPDAGAYRGRASVRGDLDGDGDLDLLTLTLDGAPRLYLNGTDAPERQMLVTLRDGNRPVFGATLRLELADGLACAQAVSASGFQSSNDPRLHITGKGPVQAASVLWPGGQVEALDPLALHFGEHVTVERGAGVVQRSPLRAAVSP